MAATLPSSLPAVPAPRAERAPWAILVVGLLLATIPFFKPPAFYESFLYLAFHWVVLATSWNILSGYSGYFSFGHGAFFGVGMYTTSTLAGKLDWPFLWTLPAAGVVAAIFGVVLGAVVFRAGRLRGELFALLTLAVTFVIATIVLNTPIDGGPGVYLSAVPLPALMNSPSSTFYMLALALMLITLWTAWGIYRAKLGTGLFAIHDDEDVAEVMGVPTYRYKLIALAVSCALAGVAGGIQAMFVSYVTVGETFNITVPLYVVLMSVLGGSRHWFGPAVGATVVTVLLYLFTSGEYAVLGRALVGLILILVILFMPGGVMGRFTRARRAESTPAVPQPQGVPADLPRPPPADVAAAAAPSAAPFAGGERGGSLLVIDDLSKSFKGLQALSHVSFEVRRGEILGLVGPNGSGKSTTINVVSGHYPASGGGITFEGRQLIGRPAHEIARSGIARTYQIPRPFHHLTVLENVALPAMFGHAALGRAEAEREAHRWIEFAGLHGKADVLPDALNLHQRKFLELARALASRPRLLLLDEVLSGLTPSEIDEAIRLIRGIRDRGTTIVFVEHVIRAVMELTDRIVVLNHGKVIAEGEPREVMQRPEVVTAYLGKPNV
jgi:branched-chain amino acid transport system permease protein